MAILVPDEMHVTPGSGTSPSFTEPAGAASGDYYLALCIVDNPGATPGLPTNWTNINNGAGVTTSYFFRWCYIKRGASALTSGERTFTITGTVYRELFVWRITGADGTTFLDVTPPTLVTTASTPNKPDPPAITPITANCLIVPWMIMWFGAPAGGWTAPTSYTELSGAITGAAGAIAHRTLASAVAEDPGQFGGTPGGADNGHAGTIAIRPASGGTDASVTAVPAISAGDSPVPSVAADVSVTAAVALSAGDSPAPTVSGGGDVTVTAVPALSTGDSPAPAVTAGATVTAVPAISLGSAPAVNGLVSVVVNAPASVAAGSAPVPTVGGAGDVTVTAVPAVSSADVPPPTLAAGVSLTAVAAVSAGSSPAPAVGFGATVTAVPALSAGQAPRPVISPSPTGAGGATTSLTTVFAEDSA